MTGCLPDLAVMRFVDEKEFHREKPCSTTLRNIRSPGLDEHYQQHDFVSFRSAWNDIVDVSSATFFHDCLMKKRKEFLGSLFDVMNFRNFDDCIPVFAIR